MITYTEGNLLNSNADALVNTVNTVGVMGKGIALMFKEKFPENMKSYKKACSQKEVKVGKMFVTEQINKHPRWIINFPTKMHWKNPSKMEWIISGLQDLRQIIIANNIKSIAIPPLGSGNGGLVWQDVRKHIELILGNLENVDIQLYEPTQEYQNITTKSMPNKLTPARALLAELTRNYLILGMDCTIIEVQKLAWFLERVIKLHGLQSPLKLNFAVGHYGPYSENLRHLMNNLQGFLVSDKAINDSKPFDSIWFNNQHKDTLITYLDDKEFEPYKAALEDTIKLIDGFESPFGMELLATIDWLIEEEQCPPNASDIIKKLTTWKSAWASQRKLNMFKEEHINIALAQLQKTKLIGGTLGGMQSC